MIIPGRADFTMTRSDFSFRSISIDAVYVPRSFLTKYARMRVSPFRKSLNFLLMPNQRDFQSLMMPSRCEYGCTVCDMKLCFGCFFHTIMIMCICISYLSFRSCKYGIPLRSEEHTSELQSHVNLVC